MKKVLVMLADGFEEIEAISVVDILRRANIVCDMCSINKEFVKGTHGIIVKSDCNIDDIDYNEYDAIVLPGGLLGATNLNDNRVKYFVQELDKANRLICAICAAPETLETFGVLKGKQCTSYPGFIKNKEDVIYKEDTVVKDKNIITSRGPATAIEFALELVKELGLVKEFNELKESMLVNLYSKK